MKARLSLFALALVATISQASTVTDNFVFKNGAATVATGSFSYDSSKSGALGYADLSAFTVNLGVQTWDLAFALANTADYSYFGYNTLSNTFEAAPVVGTQGTYWGILAATIGTSAGVSSGYFFDPLASQSAPGGQNDGVFANYGPYITGTATSVSVTAVPEPETFAMLLSGLGLIGMIGRRRSIAAANA